MAMLTVLISTMEDGIDELEKAVQIRHASLRYLIVQQTEVVREVPDFLQDRRDIDIIQSATRGIAVSRNIGLQHCQTTYALIADDDVEFVPDGITALLHIIKRDAPDFALFKIQTPHGKPAYKDYPAKPYEVRSLKHWISSIEIVINARKAKKERLRFDERFGLGTGLSRGEEEIFVTDLIRHNWKGHYFPIYLVRHPYESSGKSPRSRRDQFFFQGAYDARIGKRNIPRDTLLDYLQDPRRVMSAIYYRKGRKYIEKTALQQV